MNCIYVFGFNMKSPMLSRRGVPHSKKVSSSMIKVGITRDFHRRLRDYRRTYQCDLCNKSHKELIKNWDVELTYTECQQFENVIKNTFSNENIFGEYYKKEAAKKIIDFIPIAIKKAKTKTILKPVKTKEKPNMPKRIIKTKDDNLNTRYFRSDKPISKRHVTHNVQRWEWVGNDGIGRTFSEINKPNSFYRQCIRRDKYAGNESSILQDLTYDIEKLKMIVRQDD